MFVRILTSFAAAAVVLTMSGPAHAQDSEALRKKRSPEPIVFTVDVAEDLAGKFVPTFVKPDHVQPERGSFFVTEGRVFPAGTIQGTGAGFDPNSTGHIGVWICRGTHLVSAFDIPAAAWWVSTAQLFVLGRQGKEQIASRRVERTAHPRRGAAAAHSVPSRCKRRASASDR
jgi:hypothetical protein